MKRITFLLLLAAAPLLAGTPVQETAREFSAAGDFNGDTFPDVLVLDKTTGIYRLGYGSASGALSFAEGRPSGLGTVTGCAVGKLNGTTRDSFAATNPAANRAQILSPQTTGYTEPRPALTGVGGQLLAAFDMPSGAAPTAEDDLASFATLDAATGTQLRAVRSNAGAWSLLTETDVAEGPVASGNPLTPAAGAAPLFAYISRGGSTDGFHAWQMTGVATTEVLTLAAMPPGREWIAGVFESPRSHVFFYTPGQPTVGVRRISAGAPWTFGAEATATFSEPIEQLAVVSDPAGPKVLARFTSGALALFGYTEAGGFSAPQMIEPTGTSGVLSGLVPMPGHAFQLLFAPVAGQASTSAVTFRNTTGGWTQTHVSAMTAHRPLAATANVLLLERAPFRAPNVELLRTFRAADWATSANVATGTFSVTAQGASYGGATQGLGTPATQTLGVSAGVPGGTAVNQLHAQFSLFAFTSTLGSAVDDVVIAPAPGTFASAVRITFTGASAGSTVFIRRNAGAAFTAWSAATAPWISSPTTVEYHVRNAAGVTSPTRSARYEFSKTPALQDADGDGVPDFVEIARGLDPAGGADSDGDGFSDRDEIAAGTNPNDPASKPTNAAPALNTLVTELSAELQKIDEQSSGTGTATAAGGTLVTLHDPFGNPVGSGALVAPPAPPAQPPGTPALPVAVASARVSSMGLTPELEYLVARTSEHFDAIPAGTNARRGREMIGLVPVTPLESWSIAVPGTDRFVVQTAWSWGGVNWSVGSTNWDAGLGAAEAFDADWTAAQLAPQWGGAAAGYTPAEWETQFRAASNRGTQPYARMTLTPVTSLAALITRKIIGDQITARASTSIEAAAHGADVALDGSLASAFQGLRHRDPTHPAAPAFRVQTLLRLVDTALAGSDAGAAALRKIARSIYIRHEALAPADLDTLPMPLSALATFVQTGALPSAYDLPGTALTSAELAAGTARIAAIAAALAARPSALFTLATRTAPNPPGLTLLTDGVGTVYALFDSDLAAAVLPTDLPASTPLRVVAFTDLPAVAGLPALEVISLDLTSLPLLVGADTDGDLLGDEWERHHFGSLDRGAFDSLDGSAYSLAQEYLDGTDPRSAGSSPSAAPVELRLSDLRLAFENGIPRLRVRWPAAYAGAISVSFDTSPDLVNWTDNPVFSGAPAGGGLFIRDITPTGSQGFFRARARLKR